MSSIIIFHKHKMQNLKKKTVLLYFHASNDPEFKIKSVKKNVKTCILQDADYALVVSCRKKLFRCSRLSEFISKINKNYSWDLVLKLGLIAAVLLPVIGWKLSIYEKTSLTHHSKVNIWELNWEHKPKCLWGLFM